MIPVKIQNAQIGALSADKNFQSIKQNPHNAQKVFEEEIKKQIQDAKSRTEAAEKTEKGSIQDQEKDQSSAREKQQARQGQEENDGRNESSVNYIEKSKNGTIKHLDVKI